MKQRFFLLILFMVVMFATHAQPVVITPPSATIQPGQSVTLTASGAVYYQWSPATGLSTTEGPVTIASPTVTTTYTCEGYAPGDESVVNGDFNQGNMGFTSSYEYNSNLWGEGTYYVDSDASLHHENFHGYGHGDNGNFMMVNGSISPGTNVWTEQISVLPNKWYAFSTWACTLAGVAGQMALLQFSINGTQIGEVFSAPTSTMVWEQFYELWYSGNSTTATITILNQNTNGDGNDFGLDDISFRELVLVGSPTCTVYVGSMSATATADANELCQGESTTLHALPTGGSGDYSYSWTPANSLNNATIQHPVATPPVGTTTYTCIITDNSWGSSQSVSVSITVHPNVESDLYVGICPDDNYDFFGELLSEEGTYDHTIESQYGCDSTIHLHLSHYETYETPITRHFCQGESYDFYGELLNSAGIYYHTLQTVAHGCDSVIKLNLVEDPRYEYFLHESTCEGSSGYYFDGQYLQPSAEPYTFTYTTQSGCDSIYHIQIDESEYNSKEYNVSICDTEYTWASNGHTYYNSGDYYDTLQFEGSCDSTIVLHLTLRRSTDTLVEINSCDNYHWVDSYFGVDEWFTDSHHQTYDFINNEGCPSQVTLNLIISDSVSHVQLPDDVEHVHYNGVIGCDSARWDGVWYNIPAPENRPYKKVYQNQSGCDSIVTFPLTLEYTPGPSEIYPVNSNNTAPHWVVTATEFQINSYDFSVYEEEHPGSCHWDSVRWEFEDSRVEWLLELDESTNPPGKKCKMYVLNYIEDTVWLDAIAYNKCNWPDGSRQRYWFVCSFYGVEENLGTFDFSVVPNPNNGQMTLHFEHLTGKVNVKVYDMRGSLVDNFQTYNNLDSSSISYDMKGCAHGIYFFVVTGKEGMASKKVMVK